MISVGIARQSVLSSSLKNTHFDATKWIEMETQKICVFETHKWGWDAIKDRRRRLYPNDPHRSQRHQDGWKTFICAVYIVFFSCTSCPEEYLVQRYCLCLIQCTSWVLQMWDALLFRVFLFLFSFFCKWTVQICFLSGSYFEPFF